MICADTSSLVALLEGEEGHDVELVKMALQNGTLVVAPITVTELLSAAALPPTMQELLSRIPQLEIIPGYWERAGRLRAELMQHRSKPKIADSLIAQSCIDHDIPLVTRDRDFLVFERLGGLRVQGISARLH